MTKKSILRPSVLEIAINLTLVERVELVNALLEPLEL